MEKYTFTTNTGDELFTATAENAARILDLRREAVLRIMKEVAAEGECVLHFSGASNCFRAHQICVVAAHAACAVVA